MLVYGLISFSYVIRTARVSFCEALRRAGTSRIEPHSDAVHLVEQRRQHSLLHAASALARPSALADHRVDLVDEEDGGRTCARLLERLIQTK